MLDRGRRGDLGRDADRRHHRGAGATSRNALCHQATPGQTLAAGLQALLRHPVGQKAKAYLDEYDRDQPWLC